jgi:hypothetical protein
LRTRDAKFFCAAKLRGENSRVLARSFAHRRASRMRTRFAGDEKFARALSRCENVLRVARPMKKYMSAQEKIR